MEETGISGIFNYVAAIGGIGALAVLAPMMLYKVKTKTEALITKFGEYVGTEKKPGLHVKAPWKRIQDTVSMALQQTPPSKFKIKTSDDLFVDIPVTVQWEVTDSKKYYFDSQNPLDSALTLVDQAIRAHLAGKTFQELYSGDRSALSDAVTGDVAEHVSDYGIKIKRVVIDAPEASPEVMRQYDNVKTSQMAALAAKNNGDAQYILEVRKAESEKERDRLRGEGAALFRNAIFEQYNNQIDKLTAGTTSREEALDVMKRFAYNDTLREISEKGNLIIVTPDADSGKAMANIQTLGRTVQKPAPVPAPANG